MSGTYDNSAEEDDVESQSSSVLSSAVSRKSDSNKPTRFPVGFNMPVRIAERFPDLYGIEPILSTSQLYHSHPRLAYERNRLELEALKVVGRNAQIWDVGSGARRHAHYNIHCLCPYLQPGDDRRLNQAITNGNSVCKHKLEEWCRCATVPDVFLFVHSAYYISFDDMWTALEKCTSHSALVVGHCFEEAFGSFCDGEADYRLELRSKKPQIVMKVRGNNHEYRHPPLLWDGKVANDGKRTLDVELLRRLGDTCLWRVVPGKEAYVERPVIDWQGACVDNSQRGPVQVPGFDRITQQSLTRNGYMDVEVDCVYGNGSYLLGETKKGRVFVPKDLVSATARRFQGRVRDPALMLDIIHAVRTAMNTSRIPESERLMSQTFAAAMAFNLNVRNEIDVMHTITGRYSTVWKIHATLMSLNPVKVMSPWVLFASSLMCTIILVSAYFLLPDFHDEIWWVALLCLMIWLLAFLIFWFKRWQSRRTGDNWSSALFHEESVSHITGGYTSWLSYVRFRPLSRLREPLLVPPGQTMTVGEDPVPPRHPGVERSVLTLSGIGIASAVPTAPRTDQDAEITALTHRMLMPPTVVSQHALDKFRDFESYAAGQALLSVTINGSHDMYKHWIHQAKFTLSQQEKFQRCYDEDVKNDRPPKDGQIFNAFVKFEKMKVLTKEGVEGLKTRLINGPPDSVKVALGPWTSRLYTEVKKVWDGRNCRILYASGMTPDVIGARCDAFARSVGGWDNVMGIWDDCSVYDSTLENELLETRNMLYPKMGVPPHVMVWFKATISRGMTRHGVKYDLGKKVLWDGSVVDLRRLFSGEMDTNLIGTIINGLAHDSYLPQDFPLLMLVCGDDNLILCDKSRFSQEVFEGLRDHLVDLGLKPTQGVSARRCDWEFCSKLLWPAKDRSTGEVVTVLGPKPGRWLHRIGWSLSTPHSFNFRAAMLSSVNDVNHIPLLREYVATGLRLSNGQKATGKEYSELKHVTKAYEQVPEALSMLCQRYDVEPLQVDHFITIIAASSKVPCLVDEAWLEAASKRDEE